MSGLAAIHGVSKGGLSKTLKALHDMGLLTDDLVDAPSEIGYRRQVQRAFEMDALHRPTPYGPMLCEMELPIDDTAKTTPRPKRQSMWYVNPFALLFTICSVSAPFFNLLKTVGTGAKTLRIILYFDGINPGNPLAPDPQRLLQAVYWCFAELPNWFLRRKDSWFCFSLVREKWAEEMPGKLSELAKLVVLVFFSALGDSFHKGITITCGSESLVIGATFGGFLADEKGLKQLFGIKGQAGNVPCIDCLNVRNRWVTLEPGLQHFWDPDVSQRKKCNRKHVDIILKRLSDAPTNTERKQIQTSTGINYVATGLLFNAWLMTNILDPCSNYLRDWMHVYVSSGVAGSHLAEICAALAAAGIGVHILQAYAQKFNLPRSRGTKPSDLYFKPALVETDHVRHFASDVLGMVCIMHAFLWEKVKPRGMFSLNIECFSALYSIICILRRGDMSEAIHAVLTALVIKHNRLFLELYGNANAKIKFHHTYHMADDMLYLMGCLSCFPTERKNKDAIAVSVAKDKHMEKTSVVSFLHRTLSHWEQHATSCTEIYLINPRAVCVHGEKISTSKSASLPCGELHVGDMVVLFDGSIGKVLSFWQQADSFYVGVEVHRKIADAKMLYELMVHDVNFIDARMIVEPVFWYATANAILAIAPEYC